MDENVPSWAPYFTSLLWPAVSAPVIVAFALTGAFRISRAISLDVSIGGAGFRAPRILTFAHSFVSLSLGLAIIAYLVQSVANAWLVARFGFRAGSAFYIYSSANQWRPDITFLFLFEALVIAVGIALILTTGRTESRGGESERQLAVEWPETSESGELTEIAPETQLGRRGRRATQQLARSDSSGSLMSEPVAIDQELFRRPGR